MAMKTELDLHPPSSTSRATFTGTRTRDSIGTHKSSYVEPDDIVVYLPKLSSTKCLVPNSLHLTYDISVSGTKSWFKNNLSKLLLERLRVLVGGSVLYDCNKEYILQVYKDLWLTKDQRNQMVEYGLANENTRKKISKDDSATSVAADNKLFEIYGTRQRIRLNKILEKAGAYVPFTMNNNPEYHITLPKSDDLLLVQSNQTKGTYKIDNVQLEYETIDNSHMSDVIASRYASGDSVKIHYDHVHLFNAKTWLAASDGETYTINLSRGSLKYVCFLFTKVTGITDSEEYLFPNITNVDVTIEGESNSIYNQGINKRRFYEEARRVFAPTVKSNEFMTDSKFYTDKFALVIDLRSHDSEDVTGHGKRQFNTQQGVQINIKKTATSANVRAYCFLVSDAYVGISANQFEPPKIEGIPEIEMKRRTRVDE